LFELLLFPDNLVKTLSSLLMPRRRSPLFLGFFILKVSDSLGGFGIPTASMGFVRDREHSAGCEVLLPPATFPQWQLFFWQSPMSFFAFDVHQGLFPSSSPALLTPFAGSGTCRALDFMEVCLSGRRLARPISCRTSQRVGRWSVLQEDHLVR